MDDRTTPRAGGARPRGTHPAPLLPPPADPRGRFERAIDDHQHASTEISRYREEADRVRDELENARASVKLRELEVIGSPAVQNPPALEDGRPAPNNEQSRAAAAQRILATDPSYLDLQRRVAALVGNSRAVDITLERLHDDRTRSVERMRFETAYLVLEPGALDPDGRI